MVVRTPKVSRVGDFAIGYTTSFRMGQLLHHAITLKKPHPEEDVYEHLIRIVIPDLIAAFKAANYGPTKDGEMSGGEFILGYQNRLFVVQSDFSVLEYSQDFIAVGSGAHIALGALFATHGRPEMTPADRLTTALEAAASMNGYVRGPFHCVSLNKP